MAAVLRTDSKSGTHRAGSNLDMSLGAYHNPNKLYCSHSFKLLLKVLGTKGSTTSAGNLL